MKETLASGACALLLSLGCQAGEPARADAPADSAAGEIEWEWAGPNETALLVPVHINGKGPFPFVLDTGATLTCVSDQLAAELSLPEPAGQVGFGAGIGGGGRMRIVRIDSLRVGEARAEDLPACALDLTDIQKLGVEFSGLLGLNFLSSFRVVLDFERNVVVLHQPETP
ncbi:MAG: retroviral-like aspartic protease family protein [Gemmatimonadetes bacterium]|nr:retroviral-like aspartic protease family protein [Gemmatimonadota bacterium]